MNPVCSFCGERPVVAWFEGPDFLAVVDSPDKVSSDEAWLACAVCLALVEADDRRALTSRREARTRRKLQDKGSHAAFTLEALQRIERERLEAEFWCRRSGPS